MTTLLLLHLLALGALNCCSAKDVIKEMVDDAVKQGSPNIWYVYDPATQPKGGYVLKFYCDLDGDGTDELFVTLGEVDRKGGVWIIFKKDNAAGEYRKLQDHFFLGADLRLRIEDGVRKFSFYILWNKPNGGNHLVTFWLDVGGAWHEEERPFTDEEDQMEQGNDPETTTGRLPDREKIARKLGRGTKVPRAIKKVLLAKLYQNPNTPWRNLYEDAVPWQQYFDPADAADIASLATWTPPNDN